MLVVRRSDCGPGSFTIKTMSISKGTVVTTVILLGGVVAVTMAFVSNASPYGTFSEARQSKSESMHVAGDVLKETIATDLQHGTMRFEMKDSAGEKMQVVYSGPPPANMSEATKVVAIGGVQEGVFRSNKLLIKCPSKYEGAKKPV